MITSQTGKEVTRNIGMKLMDYVLNTDNYSERHKSKLKAFATSAEHFPIEIKQNILFPLDIRKDPPTKPSYSANQSLNNYQTNPLYLLTSQVEQVVTLLNGYLSIHKGKRTEPLLFIAIQQIVIKIYEAKYDNLAEIDKRIREISNLTKWFDNIHTNLSATTITINQGFRLLLLNVETTLNEMSLKLEKEQEKLKQGGLFTGFEELPKNIATFVDELTRYLTSLPNVCEAVHGINAKKELTSFVGFSATQLLNNMSVNSIEGRFLVSTNIGQSLLNIFDINSNKSNILLFQLLGLNSKKISPLRNSSHFISLPAGIGICPELWEKNKVTRVALIQTVMLIKNLANNATLLQKQIDKWNGKLGSIVLLYGKGKEFFTFNIDQTLHDLKIVKEHLESINVEAYSLTLNVDHKRNITKIYGSCSNTLNRAISNYVALKERHTDFSKKFLDNSQQNDNSFEDFSLEAFEAIGNAPIKAFRQQIASNGPIIEEVTEEIVRTSRVNLPTTTSHSNLPFTTAQSSSTAVLSDEEENLIVNLQSCSETILRFKQSTKESLANSEIRKFTAMEVYNNKKLSEARYQHAGKIVKTGGTMAVGGAIGVGATIFFGLSFPLWAPAAVGAGIAGLGYSIVSYCTTPAAELAGTPWEKLGYVLSNMILNNNAYETAATTKSALELWSNQLTTTLGNITTILEKEELPYNIVVNKQFVLTMLEAVISTDYNSLSKLVPSTKAQKLLHTEGKILRDLFLAVSSKELRFITKTVYYGSNGIFTYEQRPGGYPCKKYTFKDNERTALDAALEGFIQLVLGTKAGIEENKEIPSPEASNLTAQQIGAPGLQRTA